MISWSNHNKHTGFTIVELLIVIVVIGILAGIIIVAFNGSQNRAKTAKINSDLAQLDKAIQSARILSDKNFVTLTSSMGANSTGAGRSCWGQVSGTDLAALPKTHGCWTDYVAVLDIISNASGINVRNLVDPWGRPYFIDQTEGEFSNLCQAPDRISTYKLPFVTGSGNYDPAYLHNLPFVSSGC